MPRYMGFSKSIIPFLIFCISFFVSRAQQEFVFNTEISYQYFNYKDSTKTIKTYWTNSEDNSFIIELTKKESSNYSAIKFNQFEGLKFEVIIELSEQFDMNKFKVDCKYFDSTNDFKNSKVYRNYRYELSAENNYLLKSIKSSQYIKRRKIGSLSFEIEPKTDWHKPIFLDWVEHKKNNMQNTNIPNGIFKSRTFRNYMGIIEEKWVLLDYSQINYSFLVQNPCYEMQN